ncbi:MAG: tetratricopeptide repeat protein [Cyanobacteria bacterium]|nr:tetratricopeptide repeat protein [Cyanobacteriota bacterium]
MPQPEPPPTDSSGSDELTPSGSTVEVGGSENITVTDARAGRDLSITQTILQAPKPKPTLPPYTPHNLPERTTSAERFVGRSQELEQIKSLLAPEGSRAYITGMGGVGKSELAIQHAYDSLDLYRGGIVRLDARQGLDAMALQVVSFCRGVFPDLALPEDKSPTELLPLCWSQWPAGANPPEPLLLILDDQRGDKGGYEAERKLLEGLPPRFRRLITQRETAPTNAQAMELPLLEREASLELLALQAGEGGTARLKAEEQAADGLCSEVGDLPLALVLLGARLAELPDLRLDQLLADLQAKGAAAKALQQAHPELGAKLGVVKALLISWEPLTDPAKSLLLLLSVMAPAVVPWELVEACRLPELEVEEGSAFGDQQAELLRAQFLERSGPGLYQLHPLVRQFLRLQSQGQLELVARWRKQLAAAVAGVCRERIPQTLTLKQIKELEDFLPHIQVVAEHLADDLGEEDLLWPTTGLARVAWHQAAFAEALKWYQLALELGELRLGPNHPSTAGAINNLAGLLQDTNHLADAEPLMSRALAIDEASYGPDHPAVARDLNNLALMLQATNRLADAEPLMRRALAIDEASYGNDHPVVAGDLNNLAQLLQATNRLADAEPLMRRALAIDEASYGNDHPKVATSLNNLAWLLRATNRLAEAEPLMRRALAIDEASYGNDHPDVARDLNNLAQLLQATNRLAEAEPLMRRMVEIFIAFQRHGYQHPSLEAGVGNYIALLQAMGLSEPEIQAKLQALQPPPNPCAPLGGARREKGAGTMTTPRGADL